MSDSSGDSKQNAFLMPSAVVWSPDYRDLTILFQEKQKTKKTTLSHSQDDKVKMLQKSSSQCSLAILLSGCHSNILALSWLTASMNPTAHEL